MAGYSSPFRLSEALDFDTFETFMGFVSLRKSKILAKTVLYIIAVLAFQEIALRFCFPIPELSNFDRVNYMMLSKYPHQYKYLRNQTWYWESLLDTNHRFIHKMNMYGFRDKEWKVKRKVGKKRILFIGDSFVEGIMAGQDETIPKAFERALNDKNYEVWNGGMVGSGPTSYMRLMVEFIPIFRPDYVIICIYANDIAQSPPTMPGRTLTPQYFNLLRPRLLELIEQIKLNSPIKFRWNTNTVSYIPNQNNAFGAWKIDSSKVANQVRADILKHMLNSTLAPFRINNLYTEKTRLGQEPLLGDIIPFFNHFSKRYGVEPIIAYVPSRNVVTRYYYQFDKQMCLQLCNDSIDLTTNNYLKHQKALGEECAKYNMTFFDLTDNVRLRESVNDHLYWNYDEHMRAKGYEHIGATIYQKWQDVYNPHSLN